MPRQRMTSAAAAVLIFLLAACGSSPAALPSSAPVAPTPSTSNPGGALAGFLKAAANQDNAQVDGWLATGADHAALSELLKVYAAYGTNSGFFWAVSGVSVTGAATVDATHANVALSGPIVWCLGKAANDPTATCSQVTGVTGLTDTYLATALGGDWKADIDVHMSTGLDHNPASSPTAATTATPSPT